MSLDWATFVSINSDGDWVLGGRDESTQCFETNVSRPGRTFSSWPSNEAPEYERLKKNKFTVGWKATPFHLGVSIEVIPSPE